ncbi:MAG: hypothetical protein ACREGB_03845 [Candidatus Saccharimonadales bacterium]
MSFAIPQSETLGSVRLEFCAESSLIGQPCTLPVGMDLSSVTLASQTGGAGMSIQSVSGTTIILTRSAASIGVGSLSFSLSDVVNPSTTGSFFGRIQTYASTDATGGSNDYGGIAMDTNDGVQISTTVPPYLYFCAGVSVSGVDCSTASGDQIDFGNFTPAVASVAQTQMVAGTNGDNGYIIQVSGNTLTAGNNVIPNLVNPDTSRPGVSQFGMNLEANSDPQVGQAPDGTGNGQPASGYNVPNSYKFVSGDVVASVPLPDEARRYTASYIANVAKDQAPGIYVTTLTYVATASF